MDQEAVLEIFRKTGALLEGHFELRSGLHSDAFFQCAHVLKYPKYAEKLSRAVVDKARSAGGDLLQADVVISPAMGGLAVGHEVGRALDLPFIFAEKVDGRLALRRFNLEAGARVIVAEDVVTRGGRVQETIDIVRGCGAEVVSVLLLVDRSGGAADFGVPAFSLVEVVPHTYEPDECPLCKAGSPFVHPGS